MNHIGFMINSAGAVLSHDIGYFIRSSKYNDLGDGSFVFEITRQLLILRKFFIVHIIHIVILEHYLVLNNCIVLSYIII